MKTLTDQWLAEGKYTCSINEFAKLYELRVDYARELCKSANPPPGFYSGNRYKILVSELPGYMLGLCKQRRAIGA